MNLDPIRDYIAANTTLTVGKDLFSYSMPPQVDKGVLILTEAAGNRVDHEVKGVFKGRYQIIVRDTDYDIGMLRANQMFNLLDLLEENMGTYVVTYSRPRHTPLPFSRSEGDLIEFSINFDLRYRNT